MRKGFVTLVGLALCAVSGSALAAAQPGGALSLSGKIAGAPYRIEVPEQWNGTLLVYAHGFERRVPPTLHPILGSPEQMQAMETLLLDQGFALAASSYSSDGWAVKEALQESLALTSFFNSRVGQPDRTILWGRSMGSAVTLKSIEEYPGIYDGAIALCNLGGGASRAWDHALAFALAYDVAFEWPPQWGEVGDVANDIDFQQDVLPVLQGQVTDPANFGGFEFIRLVNDLPNQALSDDVPEDQPPHLKSFYNGPLGAANWLLSDMLLITEGRAELERRARGPVAQNRDHRYTLTPEEQAYLATLGVDADALLTAMNERTDITAPRHSRQYLQRYADFTGAINRPVITLHTDGDGIAAPFHSRLYGETVAAAGAGNHLVQAYTDSPFHCGFSPQQLVTSVSAMEAWIDTGQAPPSSAFPEALGFLPDFQPRDWPF